MEISSLESEKNIFYGGRNGIEYDQRMQVDTTTSR